MSVETPRMSCDPESKTENVVFDKLSEEHTLTIKRSKEENEKKIKIQAFKNTLLDFLRVFYTSNGRTVPKEGNKTLQNFRSRVMYLSGHSEFLNQESGEKNELKPLKPSKTEKKFGKNEFMKYPMIFDSQKEIFVIMNLGRPPNKDHSEFFTSNFIYPINYRMERIYKNYKSDQTGLLVYTCTIKSRDHKIVFQIYDSDKLLVSGGRNIWKNFKELTRMSQTDINLEDFFALSNRKVLSLIEEKADLSALKCYTPLQDRKQ